jgi:hypothetical protein
MGCITTIEGRREALFSADAESSQYDVQVNLTICASCQSADVRSPLRFGCSRLPRRRFRAAPPLEQINFTAESVTSRRTARGCPARERRASVCTTEDANDARARGIGLFPQLAARLRSGERGPKHFVELSDATTRAAPN